MYDEYMLTTIDNPFDPFTQFDQWFQFDTEKCYYSCSRLARISNVTEEMTQLEENKEIEWAIDEIIKYDPLEIYTKVIKKAQEI